MLDSKKQQLEMLKNTILTLGKRPLLPAQKKQVDELQETMEFHLQQVVDEAKEKEMNIKIDAFNRLINLLK